MKHERHITLLLLFLFLGAQYIGLYVTDQYQTTETVVVGGEEVTQTAWEPLPYNIERPEFEEETAYIPMILLILLSTILLLIIFRLNAAWLWKLLFSMSVLFCLSIAFAAFFTKALGFALALLLTILKVFKRNPISHNFSELFIYGGLVAVFAPVMNVLSAVILLLLISAYDIFAVYHSKHMVVMAKAQAKMQLFAGLLIPYGKNKLAVLGGGDIGMPLLFAAVVMKVQGLTALLIPLGAAAALWYLLAMGEKDKFYPAMPFITVGCLVGWAISLLL